MSFTPQSTKPRSRVLRLARNVAHRAAHVKAAGLKLFAIYTLIDLPMNLKDELGITKPPYIDFCVTCARCKRTIKASEAYIEEGDRWECEACWEICEAKDMIEARGVDLPI